MEINILQEIKKEIRLAAEKLYVTMRAIAKLTEDHLNLLPRTGLMGHADFSAKKKSVAGHYNFVCSLGEKLTVATEQRSALLSLAEKLDMLSSQTIFEDSEDILSAGKLIFDLIEKIEETEKVSGRFLQGLDRFADPLNKGENADFNSCARICREYFEFATNTSSYIDNLKIF